MDIATQANQAAQQGQQQLASDQSNSANYKGQYQDFQNQATAANQNVNNYTKQMQGAYDSTTGVGNAGSAYTYGLNQALNAQGYDPSQMTAARANLNQATGALSAYGDFANTAASKYGLNAGGFAAANSGALGNLNNNIATNQGVVTGLTNIYGQAQTGANQFTGQVVQGEQNTLGALQSVFQNASNQRDSAASMMNFYDDLAQKQGGLNAQQQQYYAQAQQAYAQATAAQAQANLYAQQAQGQKLTNQGTEADYNSPQYKAFLAGTVDANGNPINKAAAPATATSSFSPQHFLGSPGGGAAVGSVLGNLALPGIGGVLGGAAGAKYGGQIANDAGSVANDVSSAGRKIASYF